jgi:hypothetical protein
VGRRRKYANREEIVARLRQPGAPSIGVLSEETGVPKATLYAWPEDVLPRWANPLSVQGI